MEIQPRKVEFYVYTESEEEAQELSLALYEFVHDCQQEGIVVRANKLVKAIKQWKNNYFVKNFLR